MHLILNHSVHTCVPSSPCLCSKAQRRTYQGGEPRIQLRDLRKNVLHSSSVDYILLVIRQICYTSLAAFPL